jgi:hypothetical protein
MDKIDKGKLLFWIFFMKMLDIKFDHSTNFKLAINEVSDIFYYINNLFIKLMNFFYFLNLFIIF